MQPIYVLSLSSSRRRSPRKQQHRKNDSRQNAHFQVIAQRARHHPDQRRTSRTADVTAQRQQCEHRRTALWQRCRRLAERPRPHDPDRQPADCTGDQTKLRNRYQGNSQIRQYAQTAAVDHKAFQIDPVPVSAVKQSGRPHQNGKRQRSGQITCRLGDAKSFFRKRRCPLAHRLLTRPRTDHHDQQYPEYPDPEQLLQLCTPAVLLRSGQTLSNGMQDHIIS